MKLSIMLMCLVLSLFSLTAEAAWQCKAHNAKGQSWLGYGPTRAAAGSNVMRMCVRNSTYARNCMIDGCSGTGSAPVAAASGSWQCNVANARGQSWSAMGPTRALAAARAIHICVGNSAYARNCQISRCFPN